MNEIKFRPSDHFRFKIVNVNRYLYDVSVNYLPPGPDSQPSSLFTRSSIDETKINSAKNYVNSIGVIVADRTSFTPEQSNSFLKILSADTLYKLFAQIENFNKEYDGYRAQINQAYSPCTVFCCCRVFDYNKLANELANIRLQITRVQGALSKVIAILAEKRITRVKLLSLSKTMLKMTL